MEFNGTRKKVLGAETSSHGTPLKAWFSTAAAHYNHQLIQNLWGWDPSIGIEMLTWDKVCKLSSLEPDK